MNKIEKSTSWVVYFSVGLSMVTVGIVTANINDIFKVSGVLSILGVSLFVGAALIDFYKHNNRR